MPPTLRRRSGRLSTGRQDSQKNFGVEAPNQAPKTPPLMQRRATLKRRRTSSQLSSPSKAPRQSDQNGVKLDSEGFEVVEPVTFPTPSTVEIFKHDPSLPPDLLSLGPRLILSSSSETERGPASVSADIVDAEGSCRLDNPQASNSWGSPIAAEFRSAGPLKTKEYPTGPSTPDGHDKLCRQDDGYSESYDAFLKPECFEDDVPDMSPDTYIYVRNLGLHSPNGSFPEHWANHPVSFIPSTSPWGPRDLDVGRYNCLYPGCVDPFDLSGRLDGYSGRGLALHIYRRHGHGPAVDRVRLDLHKRVMALRDVNGMESDDAPPPCSWKYPGRDLKWITAGLIKDLEEVRRWERMRRVGMRKKAVPGTEEPAQVVNEVGPVGKEKAVTLGADSHDLSNWTDSLEDLDGSDLGTGVQVDSGSPSIRSRPNFFTRLRDNRFQRPRGATLLHLREVCRTPRKQSDEQDGSRNKETL